MSKVKCVHCGQLVYEMAKQCPFCKLPIANPDAPKNVQAAPWTWKKTSHRKKTPVVLIAAIIVVIAVAAAVYFLKFRAV